MPSPSIWSHRGNVDVDEYDAMGGPEVPQPAGAQVLGGDLWQRCAENSLGAFELVSALGIDGVETDTWLTPGPGPAGPA